VISQPQTVGPEDRPVEDPGMTSSASSAAWLPAALAGAAVVAPAVPAVPPGRHCASERSALVEIVAEQAGRGRHAEPTWSRELFDPSRDEDPFEWLGLSA
jgi:hypothetical protein